MTRQPRSAAAVVLSVSLAAMFIHTFAPSDARGWLRDASPGSDADPASLGPPPGPLESLSGPPFETGAASVLMTSPGAVVTRGLFTSVQVNVDGTGSNIVGDAANESTIAVDPTDPGRIVIGWRQFNTVTSNFRRAGNAFSHDGGVTWNNRPTLENGRWRSDPVLAADADGNFYYYSLSTSTSAEMFKSIDGGVSWTGPVNAFGGDKQWMAIDRTDGIGRNNIYGNWNVAYSCCPPNDFTRSTNGGASFEGPYPTPPAAPILGSLDVGPDGTLYMAGATQNLQGNAFARSTNAKDPSQVPVFDIVESLDLGGVISVYAGNDSPSPAGLLGQIWIMTDHSQGATHGNVYVLASLNPPGADPMDVFFVRSEDGGLTWTQPRRVNDDPVGNEAWQWFATPSVAPNGRIDVVWNDTSGTGVSNLSELRYTFSLDAGDTWSPSVPITPVFDSHLGWPQQNKIGDYYHMISDNGGANLAYAATFNGEQDVYFMHIDADCNGNGIADLTELLAGTSDDCNGNEMPDECEPFADCNENLIADICDIGGGGSTDLDYNGIPDDCCLVSSAPRPELVTDELGAPVAGAKNRYLSFSAGEPTRSQAVRLTYVDLPAPYDALNGTRAWIAQPTLVSENGGSPVPIPGFENIHVASLQCEPVFVDLAALGMIHLTHETIVPGGVYKLEVLDGVCPSSDPNSYSASLTITTSDWGDLVGAYDPATSSWKAADGSVDVTTDVVGVIDRFGSLPSSPSKTRVDIWPATADRVIDINDITQVLDAFMGEPFAFTPTPPPCP